METTSPILEGVIARLRAIGPAGWDVVAAATEVSPHTIRKIAYRDRKNPSIHTVDRLHSYLASLPPAAEQGRAAA